MISQIILKKFIENNIIREEDIGIYQFGIECLFLKFITIITCIFIAIIMHLPVECILILASFIPLRRSAGGYHAKTKLGCYVFSCMVLLLSLIMCNEVNDVRFWVGLLLIADLGLSILAPLDNENNKLTDSERKYFKKKTVADIDDADFQNTAKEYALEDSRYTELAKFIDIYENYDYNIKMEELIASIETIQYTTEEQFFLDENLSTLLSMMPIDTNVHPATVEGNVATSTASIRSLSGYSGTRARTYAQNWAYKTNNTDYGYYADYANHPTPDNNNMWSGGSGNNKRTWNDCANFVSQCLKAGGAATIKNGIILPHQKSENWYYSDSKPSYTWGGASNFQQHWTARVGIRSFSADAKVGDPVSLDAGGDNLADHTVIITTVNGSSSNQILYAGHTSDQFEASGKSLATLFNAYDKIWIYSVA